MLEITIVNGPANVTVKEGDSASFPCLVTGTTGVPFWYIDDSVYTIRNLPSRHYYLNWTLTIMDVQLSDNGTEYRCSLYIVSSHTAVLTVIANPNGKESCKLRSVASHGGIQ